MSFTSKSLRKGLIGTTAIVAVAFAMAPKSASAVTLTGTNGSFSMSAGSDLVIAGTGGITITTTGSTTGVFNSVLASSFTNIGSIDVIEQ